jgi:REP element-mobilizing transposase RayT
MRQQEAFSGVRVLSWTCLSNHFHVLVAVEQKDGETARKEKRRLLESDEVFLKRLAHIYESKALEEMQKYLKLIRKGTARGGGKKEKQIAKFLNAVRAGIVKEPKEWALVWLTRKSHREKTLGVANS